VRLGAVLLAAGEGLRFGMPKALAQTEERTWIRIGITALRTGGIEEIVVVLGSQAERIRPLVPADEAQVIVHPAWGRGRTGSIQVGLRGLGEEARGAMIHQVDFSEVRAETIQALARAFRGDPDHEDRIFVPIDAGAPPLGASRGENRRGHPIVIGRRIWPEVMALGSDAPLRGVVHRDPDRVREVPVSDRGIYRNLNTPDAAADVRGDA
jgi:CTP:molybdopterin cytidylyltransferase MocA